MNEKACERMTQLEIKLSYLEHTVDKLNEVIAYQDKILMDLDTKLVILYHEIKNKQNGIENFDVVADRPPHY